MTENPNEQKTCNVCQQRFNSDQELREHQRTAHSQKKGEGQSISEPDQDQQQKRDKIA